ncbi:MAG TPA: winged helix-turn-helix domain-containing protein [Nocardioides sp.]
MLFVPRSRAPSVVAHLLSLSDPYTAADHASPVSTVIARAARERTKGSHAMSVGDPADAATVPPHGARRPTPPSEQNPEAALATDVALIHWPAEADRREALGAAGQPRLLLIGPDEPPPLVHDDLEDWIRTPADPIEVEARVATLAGRAAVATTPAPTVDTDGIVRWRGKWVSVPPIEARIMSALIDQCGEVAHRSDLIAAAWPRGVESDRVLDSRIKLLRRRLAPLGLYVRTVRGLGFLLDVGD